MKKWLVEERANDISGAETIRRHWIVESETPQGAMRLCGPDLYFGPNELVEWVSGFAWAASDGSDVCYEVKDITQ